MLMSDKAKQKEENDLERRKAQNNKMEISGGEDVDNQTNV